jgi:hypothetical protein
MQFTLKWKAEFKRIDEACIKPLPFEYGSIKYDPDSILRYVEIANAHHHKWGYPKMKKAMCSAFEHTAHFLFPLRIVGRTILTISIISLITGLHLWPLLFVAWEHKSFILPPLIKATCLLSVCGLSDYFIKTMSLKLRLNPHEMELPIMEGSYLVCFFVGVGVIVLSMFFM